MGAFALTIFIGAFLLFQVQPLIGKYILPWFGGSPGVWTTCMLFFQVLLLGGYAYAHLISRWWRPRTQAILHSVLLIAALAMLPITPSDSWKPSGPGNPMLRILGLLTASIGLPYLVLSSTGPLMQQWFSQINPGRSPYRLYALSNTASLLALISYPFLFEPYLTRTVQARLWGWGLAAFAGFCGFCALQFFKSRVQNSARDLAEPTFIEESSRLTPRPLRSLLGTYTLWLVLPACASVLLLATTNKLCQDVAVIPFLWVLPLAIYLLSLIVCFGSPRCYARFPFMLALIAALSLMCWALPKGHATPLYLLLPIYGGGLFVCSMICHGELCRLKPAPSGLTLFYLMIAAGGALGGIFVALVAPLLFNDYYELHFGLFLCATLFLISCLRESQRMGISRSDNQAARLNPEPDRPLTPSLSPASEPSFKPGKWRWLAVALGSLALVALGVTLWFQAQNGLRRAVFQSRNFYGLLAVHEYGKGDPQSHDFQLLHGRTLHGMQFTEPLLSVRRTAYYSERTGVGLALRAFPAGNRRIGIVGLGVGTLASYAQTGDYLRVYEINPEVQHIASSKFTYLSDCLGRVEIVLGDARLSLETESPQNFDVMVLDAFSSDAIPVHLLTTEAFMVYGRHLKTNGIIAVNVTSTTLDLEPVIFQLARHFGYFCAVIPCATTKYGTLPSIWILLTHSAEIIQSSSIEEAARPVEANWQRVPLWTDDFTSLFQILGPPSLPQIKADPAEEHYKAAAKLSEQRDYAGALASYRLAIQSEPDHVEALNNIAWLLATAPDDSLRNGLEAVQFGEKACTLTRYRVTAMVGALAAAYAEAGRFDDALSTAEKACALASKNGEQGLLRMNQQLLQLYRAHKPYHERRK